MAKLPSAGTRVNATSACEALVIISLMTTMARSNCEVPVGAELFCDAGDGDALLPLTVYVEGEGASAFCVSNSRSRSPPSSMVNRPGVVLLPLSIRPQIAMDKCSFFRANSMSEETR